MIYYLNYICYNRDSEQNRRYEYEGSNIKSFMSYTYNNETKILVKIRT